MLVDDVTITVKSGNGGGGRVDFNRTMMSLGPTGGRGGNGGSVKFRGISDIGALTKFKSKKAFFAENGKMGGSQTKEGKSGSDLILTVPVGTVMHFLDSGKVVEIGFVGEEVPVVSGGRGGRGNFLFRSSTNTSPKESELGEEGVEARVRLELKLIADVGFIGLPNAGKSSLLNALTNAKSRVANYAFTTLEPNLGAYYELILADIPGLIEGASEGKGLGVKFLQHIERTNVLFHLVSVENEDVLEAYQTVREELEKYNPTLLQKREYVFLSKCDLVSKDDVQKKMEQLKQVATYEDVLSLETGEGLDKVKKILSRVGENKVEIKKDITENVMIEDERGEE